MALLSKQEQKELVYQAQAGDQAAFIALYEDVRRDIYRAVSRTLYRTLKSPRQDGAEEIVQDTVCAAYKALPQFRNDEASFSTWIHKIAEQKTQRWIAMEKKACGGHIGSLAHEVDEKELDWHFANAAEQGQPTSIGGSAHVDTYDKVAARELLIQIKVIMDVARASGRQKSAVSGYDMVSMVLDGVDRGDLKTIFGCPEGTVRRRIYDFRTYVAQQMGMDVPDIIPAP